MTGARPVVTAADPQVRELVLAYAALAGATVQEVAEGICELILPATERPFFGRRARIRLAFAVEAAQAYADCEIAVVGSAFVDQLIGAVRSRGTRRFAGVVPSTRPVTATPAPPALPTTVLRGKVTNVTTTTAAHPIGCLTARVVVRAGASVEEHLVESSPFDLATGNILGPDVAAACHEVLGQPSQWGSAAELLLRAPPRNSREMLSHMLADLERRLRPQIDRLAQRAQHELSLEIGRIDRYYASLLEDMGGRGTDIPSRDVRLAIVAERERRLQEERERHEVRTTVHPVQLTEWTVCVERAEWMLESQGHSATFAAERLLAGDGMWLFACRHCGRSAPNTLTVCRHDHVACDSCATQCSVCDMFFCSQHGIAGCHVDGKPACDVDTRTCPSCNRLHCTRHEAECAEGGHAACTTCLAPCAHCGTTICAHHAAFTTPESARGRRRLCPDCVRKCEGGTGEIVGADEVTDCASCERVVCERHQARCAVDGLVHCSRHLRRTDRSRRLVCEGDRAACAFEPNAVLAGDEVHPCASCGKYGCDVHQGICAHDGARHCRLHLVTLSDQPSALACDSHRVLCHIDGKAFSLGATSRCAVCGREACRHHVASCVNCGRDFCAADRDRAHAGWCRTCGSVVDVTDPPDNIIAAVAAERGARAARPKAWRMARDATHQIVELDLGWTRRLVLAIRSGDSRAESVFAHSILRARRIRGG